MGVIMKNLRTALTVPVLLVFVLGLGLNTAESAPVYPDPTTNAVLYGDAYSYSLPILAFGYDAAFGGGVGPGNPFYIASSPGQISDFVVIATKSSETNFTGMDNAYPTPNSKGVPEFSTGTTPDPDPTFPGDQAGTWDATLTALTGFLADPDTGALSKLVFYFNNNQTNSGSAADQTLYAWGRITISDLEGELDPLYFDFTNGGIPGGDPTTYTSTGAEPILSDYVLSGGQVCLDLDGGGGIVSCDDPAADELFNHNLGANQAAYALIFPEVDAGLSGWMADGYDTMNIDVRMHSLNNGYEQIFILPGYAEIPPPVIPEPSTLLLFGSGLAALGLFVRRRK